MLNQTQFGPPQGRSIDPVSGREANLKGFAASGDPIYRVPGTKRMETYTQLHPGKGKSNVPFAGINFRNRSRA